MSKVSLAVWRDAKTDPPQRDGWYQTDLGLVQCYESDGEPWWQRDPKGPHPSVWCDPVPPGEDALTVDDLRYILDDLEASEPDTMAIPIAARLRRALEEAEGQDGWV